MPESPDSTKRLEKALSGISSSEMKAVRTEVQGELQALSRGPTKPIPAPPAQLIATAREQEEAREQEHGRETLHASDIEDLQRAGKIASDFMTGMDRIADVLMLLVLKFGRASTLMRAVFGGIMIGVMLLALNLFVLWNISASQTALQEEQLKIQLQQGRILERQKATQIVAGEAKQKAEAAEQRVTEVQQKSPEITVDSKGRPQLVVKVPDPEGGSQSSTQVIRLPRPTAP